uniref:Elicitin n=1 Tax=Globisporangium sylvaticum TaxID=82950 RepID=D0VWX7_9STRA|nr:Chain A, Sylvaticin [Globisporangium sylvaticum]2POS_B Chain B, Sylvaticin [Globisporangium sylvaticum]2POS_C Chain C, Sylvaticin [Globisporangium sylvaticum]2POS_D Chain D, Sylvaticin [Globisporangium sylvaticum]2PR0_A Chain A, sylvaticin [Globisporangium sylvaticum]2PR0_B Chain B, sylvaticin [Globisporangium sylvaticum]
WEETKECAFTEFFKLAPLASNPALSVCQDASGWQMLPPAGYPTPEQLKLMCGTAECFTLIDAIKALNPNDCILVFGDVRLNVKKLVTEFEPSCF